MFSSITNFGAMHGDKAFLMIQLLKEQSYQNKQARTPSMGLMTYTMLPSLIGSLVCL